MKPATKRRPSPPPKPVQQANPARIIACIGGTGSGKTAAAMQEIRRDKPARLLVWDTLGEWHEEGFGKAVRGVNALAEALKVNRFALCYIPDDSDDARMKREFDAFCRLAMAKGDILKQAGDDTGITLVAEELTDVTTASYAVPGWRRLCVMGRHRHFTIYGMSQSPAWVDKKFFGNCTRVRTGVLGEPEHAKHMARKLKTTEEEVMGLQPLEFIERTATGEIVRGKLTF